VEGYVWKVRKRNDSKLVQDGNRERITVIEMIFWDMSVLPP